MLKKGLHPFQCLHNLIVLRFSNLLIIKLQTQTKNVWNTANIFVVVDDVNVNKIFIAKGMSSGLFLDIVSGLSAIKPEAIG